jgi:hypothetical protein
MQHRQQPLPLRPSNQEIFMRKLWKVWFTSALLTGASAGFALTPTAPAAAGGLQTFVCKDGTSVQAAAAKGACKGHKGIDTNAKAAPADKTAAAATTTAAPAAAATAAASPAKTSKPAVPAATAAPGGGPGKVWANSNTKVYHCMGDRYYGTTKHGAYVTEAEAKAQGMHASKGKACS